MPSREEIYRKAVELWMKRYGSRIGAYITPSEEELKELNLWLEAQLELMRSEATRLEAMIEMASEEELRYIEESLRELFDRISELEEKVREIERERRVAEEAIPRTVYDVLRELQTEGLIYRFTVYKNRIVIDLHPRFLEEVKRRLWEVGARTVSERTVKPTLARLSVEIPPAIYPTVSDVMARISELETEVSTLAEKGVVTAEEERVLRTRLAEIKSRLRRGEISPRQAMFELEGIEAIIARYKARPPVTLEDVRRRKRELEEEVVRLRAAEKITLEEEEALYRRLRGILERAERGEITPQEALRELEEARKDIEAYWRRAKAPPEEVVAPPPMAPEVVTPPTAPSLEERLRRIEELLTKITETMSEAVRRGTLAGVAPPETVWLVIEEAEVKVNEETRKVRALRLDEYAELALKSGLGIRSDLYWKLAWYILGSYTEEGRPYMFPADAYIELNIEYLHPKTWWRWIAGVIKYVREHYNELYRKVSEGYTIMFRFPRKTPEEKPPAGGVVVA